MITHINGAKILYLSEKANYDTIRLRNCKPCEIPIYFLALCKNDSDEKYYLFECDEDMEAEDILSFDDLEKAVAWADHSTNWLISP